MNLAIYLSVILNLVTLGLVAYLLQKARQSGSSLGQNLPQTQNLKEQAATIQNLENQFKQVLQELILKNKEVIQSTSDNLVKYYQDTVTTMTLNYNQNTEKLMQLLDQELKVRVEKLDQTTIRHLEESRKEVNDQVKKDLEGLNKQLDKYSKERFKQLDEKIYEIVSETAKNSVGKVINLVDHQELVMSALEQAKKDKFFS